jgi:hypothetical protein
VDTQATHPHPVAITQAEVARIAAGQRVSKDSTTDNGHSHMVSLIDARRFLSLIGDPARPDRTGMRRRPFLREHR